MLETKEGDARGAENGAKLAVFIFAEAATHGDYKSQYAVLHCDLDIGCWDMLTLCTAAPRWK